MPDVDIRGLVKRAIANAPRYSEGVPTYPRLDRRGEEFGVVLYPDMKASAVEGTYYQARTPTPGTGVALSPTTGTSFSDTQGFLTIFNSDAVGGNDLILDFLMIIVTTAPGSTTLERFSYALDTGQRGSGGTLLPPQNVNGNYGAPSNAVVRVGQPTIAPATNSVRRIGENSIRASVGAVGDQYLVKFGAVDWPTGGAVLNGTVPAIITVGVAPVVIPPQWSFVVNEWATARATTALSGEVVLGWVER